MMFVGWGLIEPGINLCTSHFLFSVTMLASFILDTPKRVVWMLGWQAVERTRGYRGFGVKVSG